MQEVEKEEEESAESVLCFLVELSVVTALSCDG